MAEPLLTNSVYGVTICGVMLGVLGTYIQNSAHKNLYLELNNTNIISCNSTINKDIKVANEKTANSGHNAIVMGNLIVGCGLFFILIKFLETDARPALVGPASVTKVFTRIMQFALPPLLTIGIIIYTTVLNLTYKDNLVKGSVSNEYYLYSYLSAFFIMCQIILLIKALAYSHYPYKVIIFIYCLSIINYILLAKSDVILKFFSTDG